MTIQGTLTFNLRELLQMLAFNQKVGTLVLETERGPRTIHVDRGGVALVASDPMPSRGLLRVVRRRQLIGAEAIERPLQISVRSGRYLGEVLLEMGLADAATIGAAYAEAVGECFLDLQQTQVTRFEFVEGRCLGPDGNETTPVEPRTPVEGLLLDLTRKMDQWAALASHVPTLKEVYEGTGVDVSVPSDEETDPAWVDRVIPCIDGLRTLDDVAEMSDVDRFAVLRIASALVEGGGIRPVPTDALIERASDLLQRSEAASALPLLQRALEREDAPADVRVRLADALEALGERDAAASMLDEFAAKAPEDDPLPVFDALHRALALRGRDVDSADRVCAHFLEHRPWLLERRNQAVEALRVFVQGAPNAGRAGEAAERLEAFLETRDVPDQDLILAADLYVAADDKARAAAAYCRRGEALLVQQRKGEARELFQRAVELNHNCSDARIRLKELEGEVRRRTQSRRVTALLILFALLVLGCGAGVYLYHRKVDIVLQAARGPAEQAVHEAERAAAGHVAQFLDRAKRAQAAEEIDEGLAQAAESMLADVNAALDAPQQRMNDFSVEVSQLATPAQREEGEAVVQQLQARMDGARTKARAALTDLQAQAERGLVAGEKAFATGEFLSARALLRMARNLAIHEDGVRSRALLFLERVDVYVKTTNEGLAEVGRRLEAGDTTGSFRRGVDLLAAQLESDLTRGLRLPVRIESDPAGAEVLVGGKALGERTPCVVEYSPFGDTSLKLRLPGRRPYLVHLPSGKDVLSDPARARGFDPHVKATLPEGVRWRIPREIGPFGTVWSDGPMPILLTKDGLRIVPVDAATGRSIGEVLAKPVPVRRAGSIGGKIEWRFMGSRTLGVRTAAGGGWELQTLGELERPPVARDGLLVVADESGTAYGLDASTGAETWRRRLEAPPAQPLFASPFGYLISTRDGMAWALDPKTGAARRLAGATGGSVVVLPFGDGAAILGGGIEGFRVVSADGRLKSAGDASPLSPGSTWAGPEGVAWVDRDGVRFASAKGPDPAPVAVTALGKDARWLAGADGLLYGVDKAGTLRTVSLAEPGRLLWSIPLGGASDEAPVLGADALYAVVDGGVVAVER